MSIIQEISFVNNDGTRTQMEIREQRYVHGLPQQREAFARLMAIGRLDGWEAYCEAYDIEKPALIEDRKAYYERASRLMADTSVVLRIQELSKGIVRKVKRALNYDLNKALDQCQTAYDLAYAQGDAKSLLKAIEMQSRLVKLLSEEINVNHRHGLLDDASTAVLLAMKHEYEVRLEKQKKLSESKLIEVNPNGATPDGPLL